MSSKADKFKELLSSFIHTKNEEEAVKSKLPDSEDGRMSRQPRDKRAFYRRLHSFTLKWFAKPDWLSPPVCARYGWQNVDVDILQCVTCQAFLAGRMPSSYQPSIYAECCKKLKDSLKTAHHPFCPWSNNPSPEIYLNVQVPDMKEIKEILVQLISLGQYLPKFTADCLAQIGIETKAIQRLQETLELRESCDLEAFTSASVLALCGWQTKSKSQAAALLRCSFCSREVGLWNCAQLNYNSDAEATDEEDLNPVKKSAVSENRTEMQQNLECGTENTLINGSEATNIASRESRLCIPKSLDSSNNLCDSMVNSSNCVESQPDIFEARSDVVEHCIEDLINRVLASERTVSGDSEKLTKVDDSLRLTEQGHEEVRDSKHIEMKEELKIEQTRDDEYHKSSKKVEEKSIKKEESDEGQISEGRVDEQPVKSKESVERTELLGTQSKKGSRIAEIAASLKSKVEKTSEEGTIKTEENMDSVETKFERFSQSSGECDSNLSEPEKESGEIFGDSGKSAVSKTESSVDLNQSCEVQRSDAFIRSDSELPDSSVIEVIDSSSEDEAIDQEDVDIGDVGVEIGMNHVELGLGMMIHHNGGNVGGQQHHLQNGYLSEEEEDEEEGESMSEELEEGGESGDYVEDIEEAGSESVDEEEIIEDDESFELEHEQVVQDDSDIGVTTSQEEEVEEDVDMSDFSKEQVVVKSAEVGNKSEYSEEEASFSSCDAEEVIGFSHLHKGQGIGAEMDDGEQEDYESSEVEEEDVEAEDDDHESDDEVMILSSDTDEEKISEDGHTGGYTECTAQKHSFEVVDESFCSNLTDIPVQEQGYDLHIEAGPKLHLQLSPDALQDGVGYTENVQDWVDSSEEDNDSAKFDEEDEKGSSIDTTEEVHIESSVREESVVLQSGGNRNKMDNEEQLKTVPCEELVTDTSDMMQSITSVGVSELDALETANCTFSGVVKSEENIDKIGILMSNGSTGSMHTISIKESTSVNCKDNEVDISDDITFNDVIGGDDVTLKSPEDLGQTITAGESAPTGDGKSLESINDGELLSTDGGQSMEGINSSVLLEAATEEFNSSGTSEMYAIEDRLADSSRPTETMADRTDPDSQSRKRKKKQPKPSFDPLSEHRAWCVWVKGSTVVSCEEKSHDVGTPSRVDPAWRVMRDTFLPEGSPTKEDHVNTIKMSPPVEGLRRIRKLLHGWTSPQVKVKATP